MEIYAVITLMDGIIGFNKKLDAECFLLGLPKRERNLAELVSIIVFDSPNLAVAHVKKRKLIILEKQKNKAKVEEWSKVPA